MTWTPKPLKKFGAAAAQPARVEGEDFIAEQDRQLSEASRLGKLRSEKWKAEADCDFYAVVVFRSREQRDAFLSQCGQRAEMVVNGLDLARNIGKTLPPNPPLSSRKIVDRWRQLVRR